MNQIENIIITALQVQDNQVRSQAEAKIYQLVQMNYSEFFYTIAQIIGNQQKDPLIKTSAASIFKRLISMKDDNNEFFWDKVNHNLKLQIKDLILSTLISPNISVMRGGANAIAQIASIQIPRGEWQDIIDTLAQNTQHQQYNIRKASIITLGFIAQQLRNMKSSVNFKSGSQILGSLLMGLSKQAQIVEVSLFAIRDSIQFVVPVLQNVDYCNKTFQLLMPLMNNDALRDKVYEIMYQFCKYCYHLSFNYLKLIIQFTTAHMQLRDEDSVRALTLWQTIATQYLQRLEDASQRVNQQNMQKIPNLVKQAQKQILPQIMGLMIITNKKDQELSQLRQNAVNTLTVIVECSERSVVDKISQGVQTILRSQNPGERQATILLFSCLVNFGDKYDIQQRFNNAFVPFYSLLDDSQLIVVRNSLSGFSTLAQFYPQVFLQNRQIRQIFSHLLMLAKGNDEIVRNSSLAVLCNISQGLQKHPESICKQPAQYLSSLMMMFQKGIASYSKLDNRESNEKIIIIMMNIIMNAENITVINELINHLSHLYSQNSKANLVDKQIILDQTLSLIHTSLLSVSKSAFPRSQFSNQMFKLIDLHIKMYGVEAEGMSMISAVATCFKKQFMQRIELYWHKIMKGLQNPTEQKQLFKATISCIADISRNQQHNITEKIFQVFRTLLDMMKSNIDRDIKTDIMKSFGDLSLGLKKGTQNFLDELLDISNICFEAVYKYSQNESQRAYAQELKQTLIDMYHCLVFALNSQSKCNDKMAQHFQYLCTFIIQSNNVKLKPTIDYLKTCLFLIFDCALFYINNSQYRSHVLNIIQSNEVSELIKTIKKFDDRPDVKELLVFIQNKMRIKK